MKQLEIEVSNGVINFLNPQTSDSLAYVVYSSVHGGLQSRLVATLLQNAALILEEKHGISSQIISEATIRAVEPEIIKFLSTFFKTVAESRTAQKNSA